MRLQHLALLTTAAAVSCRGCAGPGGPDSLLDLAGGDAAVAFSIPKLDALIRGTDGFVGAATRGLGAAAVAQLKKRLTSQVGIDPFEPSQYAALGIEVGGGALVFSEAGSGEPLLVLTISDRGTFDAALRKIIEKMDGANRFTQAKRSGTVVTSAGRPFGDAVVPAFHWAHVGRFVLLARESGSGGLDRALARLRPAKGGGQPQTLRADPLYRRLLSKTPPGVARLFSRSASGDGGATVVGPNRPASMTAIGIDRGGLSVDTFLDLQAPEVRAAFATEPVAALAREIPGDAAIAFMSRSVRSEAIAALRANPVLGGWIEQALRRMAAAAGIDAEKEVLPLLTGVSTASVRVTDIAELPQRFRARRSLNSILDSFDLSLRAQLRDPAAFAALLERSRVELEKDGVRLRKRRQGGVQVFEPAVETPRLGWAVVGDRYVYAAGPNAIERAVAATESADGSLHETLASSVGGALAAEPGVTLLLIRLPVFAEAASQLTLRQSGATVGLGALIGSALQLLNSLGDVAIALDAHEDGLRLRLRERLQ